MRSRKTLQICLVVLVAMLAYVTALRNGILRDDALAAARGLRHSSSIGHWLRPLVGGSWEANPPAGAYQPLPSMSLAAEAALAPARPRLYHVINMALHAAVCTGIYLLAALLVNDLAALIAALWFAVAPIHVQVVASLGGRAQLLAAVLLLAAALVAIRSTARPLRGWAAAAIFGGLSLAALLCDGSVAGPLALVTLTLWLDKPQTATTDEGASLHAGAAAPVTPAIAQPALAAAETLPDAGSIKPTGQSLAAAQRAISLAKRISAPAMMSCAAASALALYFTLRAFTVGMFGTRPDYLANPLAFSDAATRIRTALVITARQIGASFSAVHLSPDYSYSQIRLVTSWESASLWFALPFLLAIAGLAAMGRRQPAFIFGMTFAALAYLPHSNLFYAAAAVRDNRAAYIPTIGAAVVIAWVFENVWMALAPTRKKAHLTIVSRPQMLLLTTVAMIGLGFAIHDMRETQNWRNDHRLARLMVKRAPNSARAHYYVGLDAASIGQWSDAQKHYQAALVIFPEYADAWYGLAQTLETSGDIPQAMSCYRHAFDLAPVEATFLGLCNVALKTCQVSREGPLMAADRITNGLNDEVKTAVMVDLALAYLRLGHDITASMILNDVLEHHPNHALARLYYSQALRGRGLSGQAEAEFRLARQLDDKAVENALAKAPKL